MKLDTSNSKTPHEIHLQMPSSDYLNFNMFGRYYFLNINYTKGLDNLNPKALTKILHLKI